MKPFRILPFVAAMLAIAGALVFLSLRPADPPAPPPVAQEPVAAAAPSPAPAATPTPAPARYAQDGRAMISGRVVSAATGKPIAGATVEQLTHRSGGFGVRESDATDANGEYSMPLVPDEKSGPVLVRASAPGHARKLHSRLWEDLDGNRVTDFALAAGGAIRGRVMTAEREPIAGARIGDEMLAMPTDGSGRSVPVPSGVAVSGADGTFALDGLPMGETLELPVLAEGFLPQLSGAIPVGTDGVEIVLARGEASLAGRVLRGTGEGEPQPGVALALYPGKRDGNYMAFVVQIQETETDAEGRYRFAAVPLGTPLRLIATKHTGTVRYRTDTNITLTEPGETVLDLRFGGQGSLVVRGMARAGDGKPVAGVEVAIEADTRVSATTGADGRYELVLEGESGQPVLSRKGIEVTPPDGWMVKEIDFIRRRPVSGDYAQPATVLETDIPLVPALTAEGVVLAPDGSPAAGAELLAPLRRSWTAGPDGRFRIPVDPTDGMLLEASHASGRARHIILPVDAPPIPFQTIQLLPPATVAGVVVDDTGAPLDQVQVMASVTSELKSVQEQVRAEAPTDADGRFEFKGAPPGAWKFEAVDVAKKGSMLQIESAAEFTLTEGESLRDLRIVIGLGGFLEGTVKDEAGEPVGGASVSVDPLRADSGPGRSARTDATGSFRVEGLSAEVWNLGVQVKARGFEDGFREIGSILEGPLDFVLRKEPELRVLALDGATDRPLPRYRWRRVSSAMPPTPWVTVASADGRSTVIPLTPLPDRIEVEELDAGGSPTGREGAKRLPVADAGMGLMRIVGEGDLVVRVAGGMVLEGTVLLDGAPAAGATVHTRLGGLRESAAGEPIFQGTESAALETDAQGRFRIPVRSGDELMLAAMRGEKERTARSMHIVVGTAPPEPVTLELARLGTIRVRVKGGHEAEGFVRSLREDGTPDPYGVGGYTNLRPAGTGEGTAEVTRGQGYRVRVFRREEPTPGGPAGFAMIDRDIDFPPDREEVLLEVAFEETVAVRLRADVNGAPLPQGVDRILATDTESGENAHLLRAGDGLFEGQLRPGARYEAIPGRDFALSNVRAALDVPAGEGPHDGLAVSFVSGTIRIGEAAGLDRRPGRLQLVSEDGSHRRSATALLMSDEAARELVVAPGRYRFEWTEAGSARVASAEIPVAARETVTVNLGLE